jgi:hypothetical protein
VRVTTRLHTSPTRGMRCYAIDHLPAVAAITTHWQQNCRSKMKVLRSPDSTTGTTKGAGRLSKSNLLRFLPTMSRNGHCALLHRPAHVLPALSTCKGPSRAQFHRMPRRAPQHGARCVPVLLARSSALWGIPCCLVGCLVSRIPASPRAPFLMPCTLPPPPAAAPGSGAAGEPGEEGGQLRGHPAPQLRPSR